MQLDVAATDAKLNHLLSRSRTSHETSRRLLTETRCLIATSRRHLNPAFAIAGASDGEHLRALVRARLAAGVLCPVDGHSWAGYGRGGPCVVCGSPIGGAEVEYEVENGADGPAVVHLLCFMVWRTESDAMAERPPRASGAILATLRAVNSDHIVLSDGSRIFLGPKGRCAYPVGARLQIVYAESGSKKVALSIERYHPGWAD